MDEKGKHLYIILVVSFSQQCWFSLFDLVVMKKQFHPFAHCIRIYYFTVSLTQNYNRNSDLYCLVWEALFRTFNLLVCASWDKVAFTGKLFQYLLFFSPAAANKAKQNHLQFIPTWLVKSKSRTSSFLFLRKKRPTRFVRCNSRFRFYIVFSEKHISDSILSSELSCIVHPQKQEFAFNSVQTYEDEKVISYKTNTPITFFLKHSLFFVLEIFNGTS